MVRVISMRDAQLRRAAFSSSAADAGVAWSFFDGLREPRPPLAHNAKTALRRTGRVLRPGEVGCYASHFELWRQFLASDAVRLLVFEDDVLVDWAAIRALLALDLAALDVHLLKLFCTYPARLHTVQHKLYSDHSHLVQLRGYSYGTQAYLLTRTGAQRLVDGCSSLDMPVDWAMSRYWRHGQPVHAVVPFPVLERLVPSTIGHPPSEWSGARGWRLGHWWRRVGDRLLRAVVDVRLDLSI